MSVNYYARTPDTAPDDEGLHIGQHAGQTEFLFRAHPDRGLTTVDSWAEYLNRDGVTIVAESGYDLSFSEFWPDATLRPADAGYRMNSRWPYSEPRTDRRWRDTGGHPFANYEFC